MQDFKKYITILILGGSIIASYLLIVKNSVPTIYSVKNSDKQQTNRTANPLIENLIQSTGTEKIALSNNSLNQGNLSENLSQSIFDQIKQTQSADILNSSKGGAPSVDDIFKNAQINFNLVSDIDDAELKISQNNSREEKIKYVEAIKEINKKDFGDFKKSYLEVIIDVFQKLDFSSAIRFAGIYKNLADDYLNLNAPSDWTTIHKNAVIFYKNSEIVYQAMANYSTDPVKAYLGLETVDKLISDAEQNQEIFNKEKQLSGI